MKPLTEIYKERGLQGTILQLPEPLQRYSVDIEQAKVYDNLKERWLKGKVEHDGYTRTSFKMNGVVKSFTVHRLIAYAICGRILDKDELVLHMDEGYGKGNINNHYTNLAIGTHIDNNTSPLHCLRCRTRTDSKPIVCCFKNTTDIVGLAYSIRAMERFTGINRALIRRCLKKKFKQTKGFSFYYKDDWIKLTNGEGQKILDYYLM